MDEKNLNRWLNSRKARKAALTADTLFNGIQNQSVKDLSQAITLLESTLESDQKIAKKLISKCLPYSGQSIRIGITGVPGVGKSSFIESFGKLLHNEGKKVAVLAIDPSSEVSGGSILGDKTRMEEISTLPNIFIRPTPSGKSLGGVAQKTREAIYLCEAGGFDVILIETVGVGQSSTMVHSMVDFFLLLMLSGAGDELQGIKRGIMEMADSLVITKADGDNLEKAKKAANEYKNAMHLFPPSENNWIPKSIICSAYTNFNIDLVWDTIQQFIKHNQENGWLEHNRQIQDNYWFEESVRETLIQHFLDNPTSKEFIKDLKLQIEQKSISAIQAADILFNQLINKNGSN